MMRRLLTVSSGGALSTGGSGQLPPDPTLTVPRQIVGTLGINQNVTPIDAGPGITYRTTYTVIEDTAELVLAYSGYSQGFITDPAQLSVVIEHNDDVIPLTFGGNSMGSLPLNGNIETDPIERLMLTGDTFAVRTFCPGGQLININTNKAVHTTMAGDHLTGTWVPTQTGQGGPMPIGIIGKCRPTVIAPAVLGDSIAAQGTGRDVGWIRLAAEANNLPILAYGRNVMRFISEWPGGDTLRAATHILVQYGVNDMSGTPSIAEMWEDALGCYDMLLTHNPDILIWQSTPTPIVHTEDQCATLEGQFPHGYTTARLPWINWLRDGAPIDEARTPLPTGTPTATRFGDDGHPLQGIVDIAAAVEHGGAETPNDKWRIDYGPLGGDGVHPSDLGMFYMAGPVSEWMESLS